MNTEGFKRRKSVREELPRQNIYIDAPKEATKNSVVKEALDSSGLKHADRDKLDLVATDKILERREKWTPIDPNLQALSAGDSQEKNRVAIEVSKRRKIIREGLDRDVDFSSGSTPTLRYKGGKIEPEDFPEEHAEFSQFAGTTSTVQDAESDWINKAAITEGGVITIGDKPSTVDPFVFRILKVDVPPNFDFNDAEQVQSLISKTSPRLLRRIVEQIQHERQIDEEQSKIEVKREDFKWADNPLITDVRTLARSIILEDCKRYEKEGVTEFDLSTQVMMHLPTHEAPEVWRGDANIIKDVQELLEQEQGAEACALFRNALNTGKITLNTELIRAESERQGKKLVEHYRDLYVTAPDGTEIRLPAGYMGDPAQNPFREYGRTEIDANKRKVGTDQSTGRKTMEVVEKTSGKVIIFKSITPEISRLYSLGFSNLHYARDGEVAAYGAFLEGDEFPFAYSSYSPVTRAYNKDMLEHVRIDPATVLESTRAWNAHWAPENTMSTLFSFCHGMLREDVDGNLGGVVTSINPNLGFRAVSFRGVRFNIVGVKPTEFSYLRGVDGEADFMPKNLIKKELGITSDEELDRNQRFITNRIPFLPTLELLALFDPKQEPGLLSRPIYRVSPSAFKRG